MNHDSDNRKIVSRARVALASCAACVGAAAFDTQDAYAYPNPNTNQCIVDLGGIQVCQNRNALGLPVDLYNCCLGIKQMAEDRCDQNPAIDALLGPDGTAIYALEYLCRPLQPLAGFPFHTWALIPPYPRLLDGIALHLKHNYGCWDSDLTMDGKRLSSMLNLTQLFVNGNDPQQCFDLQAFEGDLATVFEPDAALTVPYGVGTYTGYDAIGEYLGIAFNNVNHEFWKESFSPNITKPAALNVSADGKTWTQAGTFEGSFFDGKSSYATPGVYIENKAGFQGCETRVQTYNITANNGMRDWIEKFVQGARLTQRWGVNDICDYHEAYCAPNPQWKQYPNRAACVAYMNSLPDFTTQCGSKRPLAGNSLPCKLKHHFMAALNPEHHCNHIGPNGGVQPNGAVGEKCRDDLECVGSAPASWPAVSNMTGPGQPGYPAAVVAAAAASNNGSPNAPNICQ